MTPVAKSAPFEWGFERTWGTPVVRRKPVRSEAICRVRGRAVKLLAQHPEIGPVWRYGNPNHPTRYLLVPGFHNYLIFYRYEDKEVRLGHLLYGAQDLGDVLGD